MISLLGPLRAGGGATVLFQGPPNTAIGWSLTGGGTLARQSAATNASGAATAYVDATGVSEGTPLTISVEVFANA